MINMNIVGNMELRRLGHALVLIMGDSHYFMRRCNDALFCYMKLNGASQAKNQ